MVHLNQCDSNQNEQNSRTAFKSMMTAENPLANYWPFFSKSVFFPIDRSLARNLWRDQHKSFQALAQVLPIPTDLTTDFTMRKSNQLLNLVGPLDSIEVQLKISNPETYLLHRGTTPVWNDQIISAGNGRGSRVPNCMFISVYIYIKECR